MSTPHLSQPPKKLIQEEPTKMKIKPNHEVEKKKKKKKELKSPYVNDLKRHKGSESKMPIAQIKLVL
ncbi:Pecanex-Like Protein 2 [Manis pentadactyla]|nr:Pecanex-Like Protein 2 [Manis pentadactyla]